MRKDSATFDGVTWKTDNRKFVNAVVRILRAGASWRPDHGKWGTVHQKFIRWQRKSIWKKLFEIFKGNKKFGWLMIDSTYVKDHQHLYGARVENQAISKKKGGLIRKCT